MQEEQNIICAGCKSYLSCFVKPHSDSCPCGICLIKTMCGSSCVEYDKFFNDMIKGTKYFTTFRAIEI